MAGSIDKGIITHIGGNKARVCPCDASGRVSAQITVPWHLRTLAGNLEKGAEVVYVLFDDQTGILLGRMDGDGGEWLPALTIGGDLIVQGTVTADGGGKTNGGASWL